MPSGPSSPILDRSGAPVNPEDLDRPRVAAPAAGAAAQSAPKSSQEGAGRRLYVETYGCQMNDRDSNGLVTLLRSHGYEVTGTPSEADLLCLNTCSVREKAEFKTYSEMGRYRMLKEQRPEIRIALLGCVAQQAGEDLVKRMPFVDLVVGTHNLYAVPQMLALREESGAPQVRADFHSEEHHIFRPADVDASGRLAAFVNILVGCDHKCTYCIVPQTRGPEISRRPEDVVEEVRELVGQGVREVTLLGQNVNSYGKQWAGKGPDFAGLLEQVARIEGLWRLRFTTPHPVNVGESLYRAFAGCEKLQSHLHLPVQSASDKILRRMKREYDAAGYREVVCKVRQARPGIALTTDIIVGFPGETEEDFALTMDLLDEIRFESAYFFAYSARPGTAALRLEDLIAPEVARERLERLQSRVEKISLEAGRRYEGRVMEILVEGSSRRRAHEVSGRTGTNWVVNFPGALSLVGRRVPVRITQGFSHTLRGEWVEAPAHPGLESLPSPGLPG